ncbi:D-2-hydroxyacid dehydrogenase [Glycocaulis profundi]|nr:D-2-hydroxyacid dehydrogenase [Glycocaulis profundi]
MTPSASPLRIRVHDRATDAIIPAISQALPHAHVTAGPLGDPGPADVLVTFHPPEDEDAAAYGWIHSTGAGLDAILPRLDGAERPPVVTRTLGKMGEQMGEYCLAYALADLQKMDLRRALQAEATWDHKAALPRHLFDRTVAVIGTGGIGSGVARAFAALGVRALGFSRRGRPHADFDAVFALEDFEAHGAEADIVVTALPAVPGAGPVAGEAVFAALKGALFMNVGRGATVDMNALRAALDAGSVRGAVLDVFETEPLPAAHWAWRHPGVTVTPHVSAVTRPEDSVEAFLERAPDFIAGRPLEGTVDLERGY